MYGAHVEALANDRDVYPTARIQPHINRGEWCTACVDAQQAMPERVGRHGQDFWRVVVQDPIGNRAHLIEEQVRIEFRATVGAHCRCVGDLREAIFQQSPAHVIQAGAARRSPDIKRQYRGIGSHCEATLAKPVSR